MRRLLTRMVISHVTVAVLAALATVLVIREVAIRGWESRTQRGMAPGGAGTTPGMRPGGPGRGGMSAAEGFRSQVIASIDQGALVGLTVGIVAALVLAVLAARRISQPVARLGQATRAIAAGRYDTPVPAPRETELAQLAEDVRSLGQSLEETEARRMRLIGDVAHEMRTPLTVIDGYVEGFIDGIVPAGPEELGRLGQETRRLRRLSDDLAALSRAEGGRFDVHPVNADLAASVTAAAERLRPQADDAGITLVVSGAGVIATHDPERMAQVVTNLVGNALRATPTGGTITVTTHTDRGKAVITVIDTGRGIAAEDLERVFERFYRVPVPAGSGHALMGAGVVAEPGVVADPGALAEPESETEPGAVAERGRGDGSGIGLTIARRIVAAHGGSITAASPGPDRGTVFTVRLPLRAD